MTIAIIILLSLAVSAVVSVLVGRWFKSQRAAEKWMHDQMKAAWESGAEPPWPACPACGGVMEFARDKEDGIAVYEHCGREVEYRRIISGFTKGA